MSGYPNLNNEAQLLKTKTEDVEAKEIKYKTELYDYENLLKAPKNDKEKYKKIQ